MRNTSLVELINSIDTAYLTEHEKSAAIAQAEASEYAAEMIYSAIEWSKSAVTSVISFLNPTKHAHS